VALNTINQTFFLINKFLLHLCEYVKTFYLVTNCEYVKVFYLVKNCEYVKTFYLDKKL